MMKMKMIKDASGSNENEFGCNLGPQTFVAGQTYEMCDNLAMGFMSMGVAVSAEQPTEAPTEEKQMGPSPENKMANPKTSKKGRR